MLIKSQRMRDVVTGLRRRSVVLDALYRRIGRAWEGRTGRERLALTQKARLQHKLGLPKTINVEPISACPLDCEFCMIRELQTHKYRRRAKMSLELFKKLVDDVAHFTTDMIFSGGEPLLIREIYPMLAYARENNIYTQLNTNAHLMGRGDTIDRLIENPPDKILLSYEGLDKETYETIRKRGDFEALEKSVRALIRAKQERGGRFPIIILQMVLTKKNMHQEQEFWRVVKDLGADYGSVKSLGVWPEGSPEYDKKMAEEYIIPVSEHPLSRHKVDENGKIVFFRKVGQCPSIEQCYIGSGGEMIPCGYILAETDVMGNVADEPFLDIWNSAKYTEYRDRMLNDWAHPLCHRCIGVGARSKKVRFRRSDQALPEPKRSACDVTPTV